MKTILKILGILIGLAVVLVIVAAVVVPMVFDPNDYKDDITAAVKERTGRDLTISGDIGLSVFPWVGIDLGRVTLGNAPGFEEPLFAATDQVNIRVKLMPLLSKEVEMDTVTVRGLTLNLARDAKGRNNWDDLVAAGEKGAAESEPSAGDSGSGELPIASLAVGGLDVTGANVTWDDRQSGQRLALNNMRLNTGALVPGKPIELEMEIDVKRDQPPLEGHIAGAGQLEVTPSAQQVSVSGLEVVGNFTGDSLPGGEATLELGANLHVDGAKKRVSIADLNLTALDLALSGNLEASDYDTTPKVSGGVELTEFNPRELMKALGQPPLETADPKALTAFALQAKLGSEGKQIKLEPITVKLDESTLKGDVGVVLAGELPAVRFALDLDAIDVDRYLPPASEGGSESGAAAPTPGSAASAGATQVPLEPLRALDVDGRLKVGKVKVARLNMSDVSLDLKAKDGLIKLSPIAARLYDGSYAGDIGLDARGDTPKISANEKLSAVQVGPLLVDMTGSDAIVGTGDISANITAAGMSADAVKQTLNGVAAFSFRDGAYNGVNVARLIREAKATLSGQKLPPDKEELKTDFTEMKGTIQFKNGLGTNNDFQAKSPLLRIDGAGTADLRKDALDYRVKTTLVASAAGQGGQELTDLEGVPIPIHVTGTFQQPKFGVDVEMLAQELAKSKARGMVEKELGDKLGGEAGDSGGEAVKGLLKGLIK